MENMPSLESVKHEIKQLVDNDNTISCVKHPNGTIIILVGTAHVSLKSSDLVSKLISHFKPKKIFIELCKARLGTLQLNEDYNNNGNMKRNRRSGNRKMNTSQDFFTALLGEFQGAAADKLKVNVGQEFRVAYHEGKKHGGTTHLFDRSVKVTLNRFWSSLRTRFEKYLFLQQLVLEFVVTSFLPSSYLNDLIERMTDGGIDIVDLVKEMAEYYPTMNQIFLEERNIWMAHYLQCESEVNDGVYIAVVGYAHVHGIKDRFQKPINPDCRPLKLTKKKKYSSDLVQTTKTQYPGFKFDIQCFTSPHIKSHAFLSDKKFRVKSLVLRLKFYEDLRVNLNGNIYVRVINSEKKIGSDDDNANGGEATNVFNMTYLGGGAESVLHSPHNIMIQRKYHQYHYNNDERSCTNENGQLDTSDSTFCAFLQNVPTNSPSQMTQRNDIGTVKKYCDIKLSFEKPLTLTSCYLSVMLDESNAYRNVINDDSIDLLCVIGSHVGDDENYSNNSKSFDDMEMCKGSIYTGPIWGKKKTKTLSAYIFVGWCITSYMLG